MNRLDSYVSNENLDILGATAIFPLTDEPILLVGTLALLAHLENLDTGGTSWIKDWRAGGTQGLIKVLQEKGFERANIGVVGLKGAGGSIEPDGYIPYTMWTDIQKQLPEVNFVELSLPFIELMMPKSDEELGLLRRAAQIGESTCERLLDIVKPGISESRLYVSIMQMIYADGADVRELSLHSGIDNPSWGAPDWLTKGHSSRTIKEGDIVIIEISPSIGGIISQQLLTIALKPVNPIIIKLSEVVKNSNKAGIKNLVPGRTFEEVCNAVVSPMIENDYGFSTPPIHSINPHCLFCQHNVKTTEGLDEKIDLKGIKSVPTAGGNTVIKPGMCFAMHSNVRYGKARVAAGGSVIVSSKGVEVLNKVSMDIKITG
jgi:Xaa-Pro aminopeptidase